jgi:AraC family transcriptional regulator
MLAETQAHGSVNPIPSEVFHGDLSISRRSGWLVARLLATASSTLEADRLIARTCIQRAAALLGVDLDQTSSGPPPRVYLPSGGLAHWQVELVSRYIREHLSSRIRIATLAEMAQLSLTHFFRAFRCSFAETPRSHIEKRRMLRGKQLMLHSDFSLAQIALEIGMCDQAHFCRTFRRHVGTNPKEWRRQALSQSGASTHGAQDAADLTD